MSKYLLFALLATVIFAGYSDHFLSPPNPPTSFVGQFYTLKFRVVGLDFPTFSFHGLPSFLKGREDGSISGTPDKSGSFLVKVTYHSNNFKGEKQVVFRIAESVSSTTKVPTKAGVLALNQFIIVSPRNSYAYAVGDKINLGLKSQHGNGPFTWNYVNMPKQLKGTPEGIISGFFNQDGYYSFSASCSDSEGNVADAYFTFNVQPKNSKVTSNLIEVPNRNVPLQYDINQVANQQVQATNAVFKTIQLVETQQKNVAHKRQHYAETTLELNFAQSQEKGAEQRVAAAIKEKAIRDAATKTAFEHVQRASSNVVIAKKNKDNADAGVNSAKDNLDNSMKLFNTAKHGLEHATIAYNKAKDALGKAITNAKVVLTANKQARKNYHIAFEDLNEAKKVLESAIDRLQKAKRVVANAKNAVDIVNQANDDAQSGLEIAQLGLDKANRALNIANNHVSNMRLKTSNAEVDLGVAKFNLQQALNNLYVAQARKEQADKATEIVKAQTSALPADNSTSTYIFEGCKQNTYPSFSGSSYVKQTNNVAFSLDSGSVIVFGECTEKEPVKKGDLISYEGYIKNGYVHATKIRKYKH